MLKHYHWGRAFFTLPEGYRNNFHNEIFTLVHYGGFAFSDVYSLPVDKRRYFLMKLREAKEKEKEAMEKASQKKQRMPNIPNVKPR